MIAHLCRLAWNRRRTNLLLVAELFLSFIVLTPLIAGWVLFAAEELEPLGFEYEDVWSVRLSERNYGERAQGDYQRNIELVWRELQALDQVEAVALANEAPFRFPRSWYGITSVHISDVGLDVLGLQLLTGRWFQSGDEALDWTPAVIDRELSQALFGDEDPVGKAIEDSPAMDRQGGNYSPRLDRVRVVGVVENCFYYGDYEKADLPGFIFLRISKEWVSSPLQSWVNFLVKTAPGAGLAVGETLRSRIQAVVPADESIGLAVESLAARQEDDRLNQVQNLGFIAVISGLMMFMVALGLTGMMWQNVRRRTREIGIRRAAGAPTGRIYGQFLGELAVIVTVAIALGCVPMVQFGLLDMVLGSRVPTYVAVCGLGATALVLYLLVLLCGLYPSWLATKVRPVEALHHD
ncbi:MAG: FtsX-like permease family protein [Gemmatimonadetes bacterium]|nr:FtsX-like permease family protein [Gemmatimonadota bacterium]